MVNAQKDEMEAICTRWEKPFTSEKGQGKKPAQMSSRKRVDVPVEERGIVKNRNQKCVPSKRFTTVDASITTLCANLSQQIYDAKSEKDFNLTLSPTQAGDMILFDDHGDLNPSVPAFAVATTDDTIILAWRGTNQVLDVVTDLGVAPVVSQELGAAASGIRAQGMFSALVGSDLLIHERTIVKYIKAKHITQIVFTGHSLGGGLASVAHLFVKAQINGENSLSVWHGLSRLSCHTLAFAAPMAMFHLHEVGNTYASEIVKDVSKNSCNFVFGCDIVPRGYAHTNYIYDVIEAVASEVVDERNPLPLNVGSGIVSNAVLGFVRNTAQHSIPVVIKYRHFGKLLYYASLDQTEPMVLTDTGPFLGKGKGNKTNLNYYTYGSYEIEKDKHLDTLLAAHLHFPRALASYISSDE